MQLTELTERIHQNIPISQHFSFHLVEWRNETLSVRSPLEGNSNDKGTFFAGSQVALCTLSGWALTTLLAEEIEAENVDVVAAETKIKYLKPLESEAKIVATGKNTSQFQRRFGDKKRAVLSLSVKIKNHLGEVTTEFTGRYFATQKA